MARPAFAFVALFLVIGAVASARADIRHGLDVRPSNTTCVAPSLATVNPDVRLETAFAPFKFNHPIALAEHADNPGRYYVAQREGKIRTFTKDKTKAPTVALDLVSHFVNTDEKGFRESQQWGVTDIALHPRFMEPGFGYIYVAYNYRRVPEEPATSNVVRFTATNAARTVFSLSSEKLILQLTQTAPYHHFGRIQFGPDGYLYVGSGDGSNVLPDKRTKRAQDPFSLYGKILRIDVNNGDPYAIPASNPFASNGRGAPEVYALGFRNPWRFSVDRKTGDVWVGDTGQNLREEVSHVVPGGNYGWPVYEGTVCRQGSCDPAGFTPPVYEFPTHTQGAAMVGGFVYRGSAIPALAGKYVFGAVFSDKVRGLDPARNNELFDVATIVRSLSPSSFGEDAAGELYVINGQTGNIIYKMVPGSGSGSSSAVASAAAVASRLSETGCFASTNPLVFSDGVIPYDVNMPLWSDGSDKSRGMALPNGATITVNPDGDFEFPVGTVLIKNFGYPGRPLHETRLFMRHPGGTWQGYTYEWRADGTDADLLTDGKQKVVLDGTGRKITWTFPTQQQCLMCHNEAAGFVLGPETAQLNGDFLYPSTNRTSNQLATLDHIGLFSSPIGSPADWRALPNRYLQTTSTVARARAYLHANCALCHRPDGPAPVQIDLRYSTGTLAMKVCNATPLSGDLGVTGALLLAPQDPDHSMIVHRMRLRGTDQMPPLASSVVDRGVLSNTIEPWILRADVCHADEDSDGDGVPDNVDNCIRTANPDQGDDNRDGYGNRCDGDFNGDLVTDNVDRQALKNRAARNLQKNQAGFAAMYDLNHDQIIDAADLAIFDAELMGHPPGPSALRP